VLIRRFNKMNKIDLVDKEQLKENLPEFRAGDVVRVYVKIKEAEKTRIQAFEGTVLAKRGSGLKKTFIVRKVSYGEGIERTFPLHSPNIERIEVIKKGKARRAKLYYLRKKVGK